MIYDPGGRGLFPEGPLDEPPLPGERPEDRTTYRPGNLGALGTVHAYGRVCQTRLAYGRVCQTRLASWGATIASGRPSEVTCQECLRDTQPRLENA